jgi:hypothetical protein
MGIWTQFCRQRDRQAAAFLASQFIPVAALFRRVSIEVAHDSVCSGLAGV